jgi:hypothetical protein
MIKNKYIYSSLFAALLLTGCGSCGSCGASDPSATGGGPGGSSGSSSIVPSGGTDGTSSSSTTITVERGPVIDAVVQDDEGKLATPVSGTNTYTFSGVFKYPIHVTGGWIDVDLDGVKTASDINLNIPLKSLTTNVTPLTTLLSNLNEDNRTNLEDKFITELGVVREDLYQVLSNTNQKIITLNNTIFQKSVENNKSIEEQYTYDGLYNDTNSTYTDLITNYHTLNQVVNNNFLINGIPDNVAIEEYIINLNSSLYEKSVEQNNTTFEPNNDNKNAYFVNFDEKYTSSVEKNDTIDIFKINVEMGDTVYLNLEQNTSNTSNVPLNFTVRNNNLSVNTESDKDIYESEDNYQASIKAENSLFKDTKSLYKINVLETGILELSFQTPHSLSTPFAMYNDKYEYSFEFTKTGATNNFINLAETVNKNALYSKTVAGRIVIADPDDLTYYTDNGNTEDWYKIENIDDNDTIEITLMATNFDHANNNVNIKIMDSMQNIMYNQTKSAHDTTFNIDFDNNESLIYINFSSQFNDQNNNYSFEIKD